MTDIMDSPAVKAAAAASAAFIPMTVFFIHLFPSRRWRLYANQSHLLHYTKEKPIFPLTKPLKSIRPRVTLKTERGNYR